ncbi:hypothetical protein XAC3810_100008 [Xanthomonas citri pv. citri]|uniref:Uncharacterized protein n=1 Tax=Xanthomonas citri pv. citri TaxID=611301 RepID=A0A0U5FP22_XANCI|nr:hypothetical protein XAC1083_110008 [Xanthomonas citri pv. citri]CEE20932.1 hypothetical protein XAC902_110008 [Xanthomonas citri pv. citri]CEE21997.1 hypothetical protein XAC3810_100008 [Xanthomonas citri pv. citri]CEE23087.1 hypothetical protein XAC2911_110008 [Xanthomonas citri pv. citri]CEE28827.1 hypothetical protein XAC908_180008 [Xanthomonas citri pv. citri]
MTPPAQVAPSPCDALAVLAAPAAAKPAGAPASERDHAALQLGKVVMINNYSGTQSLADRNHVSALPGSPPPPISRSAGPPLQAGCVARWCG